MLEQSKRRNDGYYYESTRKKIVINGTFYRLNKFRRLATMSGPKVTVHVGKSDTVYHLDEDLFYRTSGSNLSLCIYYYTKAKKFTSTEYNRKLAYRFLRRFYPEELL